MSETPANPATLAGTNRDDAKSHLLARNWALVLLRGLLGIALGLLTLALPGVALASLIIVFSAYMLADGILAIVHAVRAARRHERWGLFVFEGLTGLVVGALALAAPAAAALSFVLLAAAWALISGGFMLAAAFRLRPDHGRWWLVIGGALSLLLGALLLLNPAAGAYVLTLWFGAYALAFGVVLTLLAFRLRARRAA